MRPHRVRLTHSLVENYHLNQRMLVHRPEARSKEQIENFHCDGAPSSEESTHRPASSALAPCLSERPITPNRTHRVPWRPEGTHSEVLPTMGS